VDLIIVLLTTQRCERQSTCAMPMTQPWPRAQQVSARRCCGQTVAMESWNHSLKAEAIHGERFAMLALR